MGHDHFLQKLVPLHHSPVIVPFDLILSGTPNPRKTIHSKIRGGLISLWLYKENKLRDWKMYLLCIFPPSSTQLWIRCSNFFNSSKRNSFGCAANRKSQRLISTPTYTRSSFRHQMWREEWYCSAGPIRRSGSPSLQCALTRSLPRR
jgi:hypothetical protein